MSLARVVAPAVIYLLWKHGRLIAEAFTYDAKRLLQRRIEDAYATDDLAKAFLKSSTFRNTFYSFVAQRCSGAERIPLSHERIQGLDYFEVPWAAGSEYSR